MFAQSNKEHAACECVRPEMLPVISDQILFDVELALWKQLRAVGFSSHQNEIL